MEGLNLERFINLATKNGISFQNVKRVSSRQIIICFRNSEKDQIIHIAQQGGWQIRDMGAYGTAERFSQLYSHKGRICLIAAALVIAFAVSQCVLTVDIINAGSYAADISSYLTEIGIIPPIMRTFCDLERVRELLNWRYPDIPFIECSFRGTTLTVRVQEGHSPNGIQKTEAGNIVASRDGVIVSIVTAAGTPVAKAGDVVKKGDLLILGEEKSRDGSGKKVCAAGRIMARVWESADISFALTETETQYTGDQMTVLTVSLPWFDLWKTQTPDFKRYDQHVSRQSLGGIFLPFYVQRSTMAEYRLKQIQKDKAIVIEQAKQAALHRLIADNAFIDDFVDKWVEYSMIDNEVVCASAYGERIIDIAVPADAS